VNYLLTFSLPLCPPPPHPPHFFNRLLNNSLATFPSLCPHRFFDPPFATLFGESFPLFPFPPTNYSKTVSPPPPPRHSFTSNHPQFINPSTRPPLAHTFPSPPFMMPLENDGKQPRPLFSFLPISSRLR